MSSYQDHLVAESATWLIEDPAARSEKLTRERMRHYGLVRDLLLDKLPTHTMDILEVGGGPLPVSDLLQFKSRAVVDPLAEDYAMIAPCPDHIPAQAEEIGSILDPEFDLVICTNALDHVEEPYVVVREMAGALRPGGYLAIMCAEANALTNPHPAHEHNLSAALIHEWCDAEFETVWEKNFQEHNYRYGWVEFEGRRGQPAFAILLRKCSGYA